MMPKPVTLFLLCIFAFTAKAQQNPVATGVYQWVSPAIKSGNDKGSRKLMEGVSTQMEWLEIYAATQQKGAKPDPLHASEEMEECIIVKDGTLRATVGNRSAVLGPGSVFLLMPRQMHTIENLGQNDVNYYVLRYRSKKAMDLERGAAAGGSLLLNKDSLKFKPSARGGGIAYFDRPTAMCERFEMHITRLDHKGESHAPHQHAETEIMLVISGETEMTIDGQEYRGSPGDLYMVNSELMHGIRNATDSPCTYFAFKWK